MSKAAKFILFFMLAFIFIFLFNQFLDKTNSGMNDGGNTSGENTSISNSSVNSKYLCLSGDDSIEIVAMGESEKTTTKYFFENDVLKRIEVYEEIFDDSSVQGVFEMMKSDENISQCYSSIDVSGNVITMVLKQEYVDAQAELSKEDIYKDFEKIAESNNEL